MGKTKIEWARNRDGSGGATWNPIRARNTVTGKVGTWCQKLSKGCSRCYSEAHNHRNLPFGSSGLPFTPAGGAKAEILIDPKMLVEPLRRKKPETYFVCSMTDLFMERVSFAMIASVYGVMAACPQHTFQVLTKRPERRREFSAWLDRNLGICSTPAIRCAWHGEYWTNEGLAGNNPDGGRWRDLVGRVPLETAWPLPNVWEGTSAEDQSTWDKRVEILCDTPAAVRFVSLEPMLGAVDAHRLLRARRVLAREDALSGDRLATETRPLIDLVIVGGESGHGARPMHPAWARSLRDQCRAAGVKFFFKQWGQWEPRHQDDGRPFDSLALHNRDRLVDTSGNVHCTQEPAGDCYACMSRVGKAKAGRILDGREWNEFPEVSTHA